MTALECENARSAHSHMYSINVIVFRRYTVVYSAIPQVRGNCIDCIMQMNVYTLKALFKKKSLKKNLSCMVLNGISVFGKV